MVCEGQSPPHRLRPCSPQVFVSLLPHAYWLPCLRPPGIFHTSLVCPRRCPWGEDLQAGSYVSVLVQHSDVGPAEPPAPPPQFSTTGCSWLGLPWRADGRVCRPQATGSWREPAGESMVGRGQPMARSSVPPRGPPPLPPTAPEPTGSQKQGWFCQARMVMGT